MIRDLRDWRFRRRRVGDHLDDLRERRVLADARRAAAEEARLVDRRGRDRVARCLVRRDALTGQRRFVDRARTLEHHAVHRDTLARTDNEHVVLLHLFDRNGHLLSVADNGGRLRRELHQAFQCIRRLALRSRFEHFTDRDERQNHRRGLKIEVHHVVHDGVHVAAHLRAGHREQRVGAVHECRRRAKGDQRVHIRRAVPQALEAADEKFLVDDHDDDRQQQLCQPHCHVVVIVEARQRPAPHHVPHREVHQYDQKSDRPDEPPLQRGRRMILERLFVLRHTRGLLRRALFARAVARVLHRTDDGLRRRRALDAHRVRQQTDRAARHARHLADRFFDPRRACSAAHPCYIILFQFLHLTCRRVFSARSSLRGLDVRAVRRRPCACF